MLMLKITLYYDLIKIYFGNIYKNLNSEKHGLSSRGVKIHFPVANPRRIFSKSLLPFEKNTNILIFNITFVSMNTNICLITIQYPAVRLGPSALMYTNHFSLEADLSSEGIADMAKFLGLSILL